MLIASGGAAIGTQAAANPLSAFTVRPRQRVIIDNDFSADPDGLFQLAHHLASPSVEIPFVIGSHTRKTSFLDNSSTQAENAVRKVRELYSMMKGGRRPQVLTGRNAPPPDGAKPALTPAVKAIIDEALRTDTSLPLYYAAGAGLTEIAEAIRLEPAISRRITLVWIGGLEHPDLTAIIPDRKGGLEFNQSIDLRAVQTVFNYSDIEIWQVPINVYRQLNISHAELIRGLQPAGRLGDYLAREIERVLLAAKSNLGETFIMGDSPLVTLTALQSSFDPDSSSSAYVVKPTPAISPDGRHYEPRSGSRPMRVYTSIDVRLTFEDMFAKFVNLALD